MSFERHKHSFLLEIYKGVEFLGHKVHVYLTLESLKSFPKCWFKPEMHPPHNGLYLVLLVLFILVFW